MSFNKEEKSWLAKFEARLVEKGMSRAWAVIVRNGVVDIDLKSSPEECADYEVSCCYICPIHGMQDSDDCARC